MSDKSLLDKLEQIAIKYEEIAKQMVDPDVISDMKKYVRLNQEYKDLKTVVETYNYYKNILNNINSTKELIQSEDDKEFRDMAKLELIDLQQKKVDSEEKIKWLLIPKDPNDNKNVIMEIRAGTGGDEACIFVEDIFRMFTMYFKENSWTFDVLNSNEGGTKGFREISMSISGNEVYGKLKFESGVHRVQRVPTTETSGRIHTSAATVAVLPEAEDLEILIEEKDLRVDVFRSSGPGGQSVNTTDSAVRITHIPSGIVVSQQDEKSQHKNRAKAMKILQSRLYESERQKQQDERSSTRKDQVGTGDRSERIRTYNFPQGRVTDHRINLTLHKLEKILSGEALDELIDALVVEDRLLKMTSND